MRHSAKLLLNSGFILAFFVSSCQEDPIPIIKTPDDIPKEPIAVTPNPNLFRLNFSQNSICPNEKIQISITDLDNRPVDFENYKFHLNPTIGVLNLDSGYYQAPASLESEIFIELWAESKIDTSLKSGKVIRIQPKVSQSYILSKFNGVIEAVDSNQLPSGALIFASNNPAEPPGISGVFDFEIFCTDQKGNLLWKNKLGKGTLRRLYVGAGVIYGLGYLNSIGFVVVKFDFNGNHLATKYLGIGEELNPFILENLKGTFNDQGDFFISYGIHFLSLMLKLDNEMNLSTVNSMPTNSHGVHSLDGSRFLIDKKNNGGFDVTDSELIILWGKTFELRGIDITRAIKSESGSEIWSIFVENNSNSISIKKYDLSGNQIVDKKITFKEGLILGSLHDLVQLQNDSIWLVASSRFYPSSVPFLNDENFYNHYHLIQLSKNGDILKETFVSKFNFTAPSFPGGWQVRYQGLFQGQDGLILTGQWYYNFVIQISPEGNFSVCN